MRLSTIKLAGFKSFVDPTTLHLPTNLTAVVGPNGCGKSNIIDAVRWVMGESAASRLRGDSLTDVIFSGSSARKPVGSATVELIFDNSDGTLIGEYASYNEISVKRSVSRDGSSAYFLNGTRCRRRDITDLFLGTGLGARSYATIEQGMISEIIEAAPEQLRVHLEEAAGISKYKERRKETETRIRHTRENLERLDDLREEIGKQIEHLNRQARAAERWQELKTEQARVLAELRVLELRRFQADLEDQGGQLGRQETELERIVAEQRQVESALETIHVRQSEASERFNAVQAESYRVAGEIARIEQTLGHQRDLAERLARQQAETAQALAEVEQHIAADQEQIESVRIIVEESEPRLLAARDGAAQANEQLAGAEAALADWQSRYDSYARDNHASTQAAEVERTRIELLDKQCLEIDRRLAVLADERDRNESEALATALANSQTLEAEWRGKLETASALMEERRQAFVDAEANEQQSQRELAETRQRDTALRGRLASLEALQQAALGDDQPERRQLLAELELAGSPRLGASLKVRQGWESAVETVLAGWLDAMVGDDPSAFIAGVSGQAGQGITIVSGDQDAAVARPGTLAELVEGPLAAIAALNRVRVAADSAVAQRLLSTLADDESVVTPDGVWMGRHFLRTVRGAGSQSGLLARETELVELRRELDELVERKRRLDERVLVQRDRKREAEIERDDAQRTLYQAHRTLGEIAGQVGSQQGKLDNARQRLEQVGAEITSLRGQLQGRQEEVRGGRHRLEEALGRMGELEDARGRLDGERRALLEARETTRVAADRARSELHAVDRELEARRSTLASLEQALGRMRHQQTQLVTRNRELGEQLVLSQQPQAELETGRQTALDQRVLVDKDLAAAREALEAGEAEFRRLEQNRHRLNQTAGDLREKIGNVRMQVQALQLRADALNAEVAEAGFEVEALANSLADEAQPEQWRQSLETLENKIRRLEPVNLAAIQEHEEQARRKEYLDAQNADLTSALETLEAAIQKIDRETRGRFKDTFDRVNAGMQDLFPRLFGGGHAYLELTGEDLLTTGVAIMARPPGKRVSNISLLSGGEKALTAVSLVFAIFRLNPAPFCLLDEVDAPLDEANVGRFSSLVLEMSESVQFVCVTHNKVTMEAARQLCGVTMREPGVSRLVTVDLAEAAELAGAP